MLHGTRDRRARPGRRLSARRASGAAMPTANGILLVDDALRRRGLARLPRPLAPARARARRRSTGLEHEGAGELESLTHLEGDRFVAHLQHRRLLVGLRRHASTRPPARFAVDRVLVGRGRARGRRPPRARPRPRERALRSRPSARRRARRSSTCCRRRVAAGAADARARARASPRSCSRAGEDASFDSHDGLRVSARLYLPSPSSASTGRGRSSTTSTAARRARSGRTSPGSRCR